MPVVKAGQRILHIDIFQTVHQHAGTLGFTDALQHLVDVYLPLDETELVVDAVVFVGEGDVAKLFVFKIQRDINIRAVGIGVKIIRQQVLF